MVATERHHKDTLQQMEHKFFEEKVLVLFHAVEHTVYITCNVLVNNNGLFLMSCDLQCLIMCFVLIVKTPVKPTVYIGIQDVKHV